MTQRVSALRKTGIAAGILAGVGLIGGLGIVSGAGHGDHSKELRDAIDGGRAKNVILFIGDGMGDSEITIARNYQQGANGRLRLDTLPLTGAYTTYALTCLLTPEVPNNEGAFRPVRVVAPEGCILNCRRPAPVSARHIFGHFLPGLIFGALRASVVLDPPHVPHPRENVGVRLLYMPPSAPTAVGALTRIRPVRTARLYASITAWSLA